MQLFFPYTGTSQNKENDTCTRSITCSYCRFLFWLVQWREDFGSISSPYRKEIEVMSQKNDGGDRASIEIQKSLLLEIIKQALAWWATSLSIQTILGERCVNKKEIPSLIRSRMNCNTNSKLFSKKNSDDEVEKNAELWGYTVIDIPKDGLPFQVCCFLALSAVKQS